METNAVIVSGPHKGRKLSLSTADLTVSWEDPDRPGVLCRYSSRSGDPLLEGRIQLHHTGDATPSPGIAKAPARP
jgi:hypothetical protein